MNHNLRVFGLVLLGVGAVVAVVTALALAGAFPLQIDLFGHNIDTRSERIALGSGALIVAIAGAVLLRISKRPSNNQ